MALFFVNLSQGLNTILIPSVLTSNCVNKKVLRVSFHPGARNLRDCVKLNRTVFVLYWVAFELHCKAVVAIVFNSSLLNQDTPVFFFKPTVTDFISSWRLVLAGFSFNPFVRMTLNAIRDWNFKFFHNYKNKIIYVCIVSLRNLRSVLLEVTVFVSFFSLEHSFS